ncbi:MAG: hypothetical protein LN417_06400, partial [Candidatus Thermoplasmatota archaeon]|nr:hypothetical protein [Candidatus Thermoplasmatota archaeon]
LKGQSSVSEGPIAVDDSQEETLLVHEEIIARMASPPPERPFNDADRYIDPVHESLKLKAEAAEKAVEATKHHASCMSLRSKVAGWEFKKAKLAEEKARVLERSKFYAAQANRGRRELDNSDVLAEHVAEEMNRTHDKAAQLKRKCAGLDVKIDRLREKVKDCEERATREEDLKAEAMEQSKQLEIQAMNYAKS